MSENNDATLFQSFLSTWQGEGSEMAAIYCELYGAVEAMADTSLNYMARPGVSYSMRPVHGAQSGRKFFAIMDIIDDDPEDHWLSICFYGDMITDPEERGSLVPGGLSGDDGYCFDMYSPDPDLAAYLLERLKEAHQTASK